MKKLLTLLLIVTLFSCNQETIDEPIYTTSWESEPGFKGPATMVITFQPTIFNQNVTINVDTPKLKIRGAGGETMWFETSVITIINTGDIKIKDMFAIDSYVELNSTQGKIRGFYTGSAVGSVVRYNAHKRIRLGFISGDESFIWCAQRLRFEGKDPTIYVGEDCDNDVTYTLKTKRERMLSKMYTNRTIIT